MTIVVVFFVCLEASLRLAGYNPRIQFRDMQLPYWVAEMDSTFFSDYKNRLIILGKVNQDFYAYRPDPLFGYLLKPNYKRQIAGYSSVFPVENMPGWTLISSEDGYRTGFNEKQVKKETLPGASIFILGDSSSFGWGVDFEDTYGFVLTEIINRSLKPGATSYPTINRAMPGFSTFDGLKTVREIINIKPGDQVLVSFGSNDHAPASMTDHQRSVNLQSAIEKFRMKLERFLFFKMLKSFWLSSYDSPVDEPQLFVNRVPIDEYSKNLKIMFDTIKSRGGMPIFVSICNFKEYASAALKLTTASHIPFVDFIKQVRPFLNEIPRRYPEKFVKYFNAYGEKMEEDELYAVLFPDGCHPNVIGHRLLGEVIFEALEWSTGETSKSGRKLG